MKTYVEKLLALTDLFFKLENILVLIFIISRLEFKITSEVHSSYTKAKINANSLRLIVNFVLQ